MLLKILQEIIFLGQKDILLLSAIVTRSGKSSPLFMMYPQNTEVCTLHNPPFQDDFFLKSRALTGWASILAGQYQHDPQIASGVAENEHPYHVEFPAHWIVLGF